MSETITVTLSGMMEQLAKMPTLTGKQAGTYMCGPNTYEALKVACDVRGACKDLSVGGVTIYSNALTPDNGKFYPADYLESKPEYPLRAYSQER